MRNIHIFKTDKLTRLHGYAYGELGLSKKHLPWKEGRNIYITNDHKPRQGDWFWNPDYNMIFKAEYTPHKGCKKVILTTDRDLDGVQSIDDDFLEWFVKNPSCEEVKVFQEIHHFGEVVDESYPKGFFDYKIIIPKEEQKQDPLEQAAKKYAEMHQDVSGNLGKYLVKAVFQDGAQWQAERMYSEEEVMDMFHNLSMHLPLHYEFLVKEQFKKK